MTKRWWLRLAGFAVPYWRGIAAISLLTIVGAGLSALKPWPMKLLVDYVFVERALPSGVSWFSLLPGGNAPTGLCAWLAASTLLIFSGVWAIQTLLTYVQSGFALRITYNLGGRVFEHLQQLSLRFHSRRPTGDLVRRVTQDSRCAKDLVLNAIAPASTSLVTLLTMFVVMWQMDRTLTLLALLVIPALLLAEKLFYQSMMERTYDQQQWEGAMMSHAERALTALPMVQSFRREAYEEFQFRQTADRTLGVYFRALSAQLKFKFCVSGASTLGRVAVTVFGGYRVLQGDLTVGDLLVFVAYVAMLYEPLDTLAHLAASVAVCEAGARRVFEVLESEDRVHDSSGDALTPHRDWRGNVTFEDVSFAYEREQFVLRDIDLQIQQGECIALVGPTGAGKSTLMSLLLRFFDPCEGQITLDGIDLRSISISDLRANIAILLQEPFLLPVSVAENIAYGHPSATREEVVAAASAANANVFVQRLPHAYDTVIGDRGTTLSGGERQRIAIARALLKNAPLLILDEPTSALDALTESEVMQAVDRLVAGRTTFIIAHRLSTIRNADRIVVLDQGRVVEFGSHAELASSRGVYHGMLAAQSNAVAANR